LTGHCQLEAQRTRAIAIEYVGIVSGFALLPTDSKDLRVDHRDFEA